MTNEVKIAHISDLHISGMQDRRQLDSLSCLFDHFNTAGYDHLVISGDLSNSASPGDWKIVREKLESHGLYHWDKTTVIPGNHDLISLEEEMRFYNALNPLPQLRKKAFDRRVVDFCLFFQELITGDKRGNQAFPFLKIINYSSVKIALAALNSVYPWYPADNPLGARGYISTGQLRALSVERVLTALADCFVIGLCHHAYKVYGTDSPIDQAFDWTMELKNRDEFLGVMKAIHAKLVLHGHFHRFQSYGVKDITFINGGSFRYNPLCFSQLVINGQGCCVQKFVALPIKS
ncbi:MAG: metallophosphoesterase [Chlorobiaceae bacterium]|nr:metallophosphoesterase [Chlorobiaceae bacterium]